MGGCWGRGRRPVGERACCELQQARVWNGSGSPNCDLDLDEVLERGRVWGEMNGMRLVLVGLMAAALLGCEREAVVEKELEKQGYIKLWVEGFGVGSVAPPPAPGREWRRSSASCTQRSSPPPARD